MLDLVATPPTGAHGATLTTQEAEQAGTSWAESTAGDLPPVGPWTGSTSAASMLLSASGRPFGRAEIDACNEQARAVWCALVARAEQKRIERERTELRQALERIDRSLGKLSAPHQVGVATAQLPIPTVGYETPNGPLLVQLTLWSDGSVIAALPIANLWTSAADTARALEVLAAKILERVDDVTRRGPVSFGERALLLLVHRTAPSRT